MKSSFNKRHCARQLCYHSKTGLGQSNKGDGVNLWNLQR
jgi:hypothetical protein